MRCQKTKPPNKGMMQTMSAVGGRRAGWLQALEESGLLPKESCIRADLQSLVDQSYRHRDARTFELSKVHGGVAVLRLAVADWSTMLADIHSA
jgi:hypothetical protein